MTVYELNRDQLAELKARYYADKTGEDLSYDEIADIDNLVSDAEIFRASEDIEFSPDDFSCSAGEDYYPETCRLVIEGATRSEIAYVMDDIAGKIENGYTNGIAYDGSTWYIE